MVKAKIRMKENLITGLKIRQVHPQYGFQERLSLHRPLTGDFELEMRWLVPSDCLA